MSDPSTPTRPRPGEPLTVEMLQAELQRVREAWREDSRGRERERAEAVQREDDTRKRNIELNAECEALRQSLVALTEQKELADWKLARCNEERRTDGLVALEYLNQIDTLTAQRTEAEQALAGLREAVQKLPHAATAFHSMGVHWTRCDWCGGEWRTNHDRPVHKRDCPYALARLTPQGTPQDQESGT